MYQTLRTSSEAPSNIANISNPPLRQFAARVVIASSQIWNASRSRSGLAMPRGGRGRVSPLRSSYALLESSSSTGLLLLVWRTQIKRATLQRYFSLRKTATIVGERPSSRRKRREARLFVLSPAASELTPNGTICPDARTARFNGCVYRKRKPQA